MRTQRKRITQFCWLFLCSILLLSFFTPGYAGSIREEMAGIENIDLLEQYYNENIDDLYKRRYIIKYIPGFLESTGSTNIPKWIYNAIHESLNSTYDALIEEAVIAAGKLEIAGFTDEIVRVYMEAPRKHTAYSSIMRCAAVTAIIKIGGDYARSSIPQLIQGTYRHSIVQPEFGHLLNAIRLYGDSTVIDSLRSFKTHAEQQAISRRSKNNLEKKDLKYENLAVVLSQVIEDINKKEDANE